MCFLKTYGLILVLCLPVSLVNALEPSPEYWQLTATDNKPIFASNLWVQYSHNHANQAYQQQIPGFKMQTHGYSIGWNTTLGEEQEITTGIFYTAAQGDIHSKDDNSQLDTKDHIVGINTSWYEDNFFFHGQLQYARGENHGNQDQHKLRYDNQHRGFSLTAGYTYALGQHWQWQPWASFNRYSIETDNIHSQTRLPLNTPFWNQPINKKYRIKEAGGGLRLIGNLNTDALLFKPEIGIQGFHNFKDDPIDVVASFDKAGTLFMIDATSTDHRRYQFDLGLALEKANQTFLTLKYAHQWSDNFKVDGFIATTCLFF